MGEADGDAVSEGLGEALSLGDWVGLVVGDSLGLGVAVVVDVDVSVTVYLWGQWSWHAAHTFSEHERGCLLETQRCSTMPQKQGAAH